MSWSRAKSRPKKKEAAKLDVARERDRVVVG